ncbi:MAG: EamA family transporter [Actinobacteria bacterium HGW-Actinobacteria-4]|nr:MAG: EamA family transporter [Actinobacteria bacterium HGW-Actinobacteria-4]
MSPTFRVAAVTSLAPILWGTTYLVTTELIPDGGPLQAATVRALPAGLALLALTRTLPRGAWWWKSAVLGFLNIGAFFALLFVAAYRLPGGVAATLGAVHPLMVAVLAIVVLREVTRHRAIASAIVGLSGVAMLVLTPNAALDVWGATAALLGGASTALGVILTKKWGRPTGLLNFTAWQLVGGGLFLLIPMLMVEGVPSHLSATSAVGYAWLAFPGTAVAYAAWFYGIFRLPAPRVSILAFLAPLVATVLGWAVLGESLTPLQLVGAAVVVCSVWYGQKSSP